MARRADVQFKSLLEDLIFIGCRDENPRPVWQDGTPAYSYFLTQCFERYDTQHGEVPITSLRPIYFKKAVGELLWIYQNQSSDLNVLKNQYGVSWWDSWDIGDGTIGEVYGKTVSNYNLVDNLLKGLKEDPFGRRHIMNLWQETDFTKAHGLKPCAFMTMWSCRKYGDGEMLLDCTLVQRSNDVAPAMHINLMQYHALQLAFCKHLGYKVGTFARLTQNIHLYERHIEQASEMIDREGQITEPKFYLNVPDGTSFYDIKVDDFVLENYHPVKPQLKFEVAV